MARPQKNNVDYFPFICEEGKKMYYIEETYGNDGFATFVKILRELAKTDFHYLDLSKNTTVMYLSAKCKVKKETLLSIISDLTDLGKFDELLWAENSIIWCQDFIDSIQDAYIKRNNKCINYNSLLQHLVSLGVRKQSKSTSKGVGNTQSKEEYSILNNNKVEEIKKIEKSEFDLAFDAYLEMRKKIKKPATEKAIELVLKKLDSFSSDETVKIQILNKSIVNSWQDVYQLKPNNGQKTVQSTDPYKP